MPRVLAVNSHVDNRAGAVAIVILHAQLIHQLAVACSNRMPINRGGNAVTAEFFNICHAAAVDFLSVGFLQTLADGVRGRAFGQRRIFEQLCFVHRAVMNGRDLKHAARQRTGLVENNDICFGQGLQIVGALDQNALFAGPADTGEETQRNADDQCARAADD